MTHALPKRFIAESNRCRLVRVRAKQVLGDRSEFLDAVAAGDFQTARRLVDNDDSLSALELALAHRLMRLAHIDHFRVKYQTSAASRCHHAFPQE